MNSDRLLTTVSAWALLACLAAPAGCSAQHATATARASQQRSQQTAADVHTWKMKKVSQDGDIGLDPLPNFGIAGTPHKHVTIVSMLVPSDWTFQTQQDHPAKQDCNLNSGKLILLAISPDRKSVFLSKPVPDTAWSNDRNVLQAIAQENQQFGQMQHCVVEQPQPLAQRMNSLSQQVLPGLTPAGSLEPIPELGGKLPQMIARANANLEQQAQSMGQRASHIAAEAARLRYVHHDASGDGEGYLYAMQVVRTDQLPTGGVVVSTSVPMLFFTAAPQGQLNAMEPMFAAMAGSIEIDPEYQAECMQVQANMMHIHQLTKQRLAQIGN